MSQRRFFPNMFFEWMLISAADVYVGHTPQKRYVEPPRPNKNNHEVAGMYRTLQDGVALYSHT